MSSPLVKVRDCGQCPFFSFRSVDTPGRTKDWEDECKLANRAMPRGALTGAGENQPAPDWCPLRTRGVLVVLDESEG